jgi:ABC-type transporter Mla subunit MlaD
MTDDARHDGLADVINLLAAPIAGGIRTVEQMKRGVDEMFRAVENLNRTMENLNEAAERVNAFLAEIEPPVRALIPQITRTVQTVDEITSLLEKPVRTTAPQVERIVGALGSPGFLALPNQLGELMQRLSPLAQFAENAGGLFGMRLSGAPKPMTMSSPAAPADVVVPEQPPVKKSAAKKSAAKKPAAKRSTKPPAKAARR